MPALAGLLAIAMIAHGGYGALGRHRSQRDEDAQLQSAVTALGLIALEMRSGASPDQALAAAAGACGVRLPGLAAAAADPDRAAEELAVGPLVLRGLGVALRLSRSSGASLAALCERLALAAAAEQAARRELSDGLAGARSTAVLLTGLPVAGLAFATLVGAHPLALLLGGGGLGSTCLVVGVALVRAGQSWTWRLVRRASRKATG